jgi:hypothetical protein
LKIALAIKIDLLSISTIIPVFIDFFQIIDLYISDKINLAKYINISNEPVTKA